MKKDHFKKYYRITLMTLSLVISNVLFFNVMGSNSSAESISSPQNNEEDFTLQAQSLVKLTTLKPVTLYTTSRQRICDGIFIQLEPNQEDYLSGQGESLQMVIIRMDKLCAMKRLPKNQKILIGPRSSYEERRLTEVDYEIHF